MSKNNKFFEVPVFGKPMKYSRAGVADSVVFEKDAEYIDGYAIDVDTENKLLKLLPGEDTMIVSDRFGFFDYSEGVLVEINNGAMLQLQIGTVYIKENGVTVAIDASGETRVASDAEDARIMWRTSDELLQIASFYVDIKFCLGKNSNGSVKDYVNNLAFQTAFYVDDKKSTLMTKTNMNSAAFTMKVNNQYDIGCDVFIPRAYTTVVDEYDKSLKKTEDDSDDDDIIAKLEKQAEYDEMMHSIAIDEDYVDPEDDDEPVEIETDEDFDEQQEA